MKSISFAARDATRRALRNPALGRRACALAAVMAGSVMVAGCITLNAPDKAIVIELNIKIEQDVVYKLAPDVQQTVDKNKDIF
ncbi:YnbE family lipoprotein [Novosphingobium rosa]|uniref:YnbE family lipoprotein n=1 Tax=Novosphingobium rosa TaxID=76978 RepID=UPI00083681D9|nr:YnbE family lipoprotein [Novosphingobium rosa]